MPVTAVTKIEAHSKAWSGDLADLRLVLDKFQEQAIRVVGTPPDDPNRELSASEKLNYDRQVLERSVFARYAGGIHRTEISGLLSEVLSSVEVDLTKAVSLRVWCGGYFLRPTREIELRFETAAYASGVTLSISAGEAEALSSQAVIWPMIKANTPIWAGLRGWLGTLISSFAVCFVIVGPAMLLLDEVNPDLDSSSWVLVFTALAIAVGFASVLLFRFIAEKIFPGFEVADGARIPGSKRLRTRVWQVLGAAVTLLGVVLTLV